MMNENWIESIELIVFDVDGTLAETDDFYVERAASGFRRILPFVSMETAEKIVRPFVMTGETILHSCYRFLDLIGLDGILSRTHSRFSITEEYRYKEVCGMKHTLKKLRKHYRIGIITSGGRDSTRAFIRKYGMERLIGYVISAEDCRYIKPHPMPLFKIAEAADVPIRNCLMVGDTVFDVICAKRAGARSAAVKTGFDSELFLKWHRADILLDSVNDLPEKLLNKRGENE